MKKIIFILACFTISCGESSLDQKKKKVDELKNSLVEIYTQIDNLEKEISELDSTFGSKNYELVSVISPENGRFSHQITLRGNIISNMNILIVPEVMGQVNKVLVKEGETVKKGQILASINSDVIKSNLDEVESSLNLLKIIFDRQSNLWSENIGSEIDYLRSKTNYESAMNRFKALKLQASKYNIKAPFSGIIESVDAKIGEISSPGLPAFRMFNDGDSYISIDVPENYMNAFKVGDTVLVNRDKDSFFESIIISTGQVINPTNRTFSIGVEIIENFKNKFKPNQVVNVILTDYKNEDAISIPSNIIFSDERGNYIFIVDEFDGENIARKLPILTGKSFEYKTEILRGLVGDEVVIDKGSSDVVDGVFIKIKDQ